MNKKLLRTYICISLLFVTSYHASASSMTLPQNESNFWKLSPFRIGSHLLWGSKLGQDFWESNASSLNESLQKFKDAKNNDAKIKILQDVMEQSSKSYQNVIGELESKYRTAMSYIIDQFQNVEPNSKIVYLPDTKLVTMYKKDASDREISKIMADLLKKADEHLKKQSSSLFPSSPIPPISPVTINIPGPTTQQSS